MADPKSSDLTETFTLVRQAKSGENEALGRLFNRYYERVRKIARLRLGEKLRGVLDSDDILQETFIGAIKTFDRFEMRDEASMINWLARIAERAIIAAANHFSAAKRAQEKQVRIDADDSQDRGLQVPDNRRGPGTSVEEKEQERIIEECISELPEDYRELIVLKDYLDYGWEEVAREHSRPSADAARMMHAKAWIELNKLVRKKSGQS